MKAVVISIASIVGLILVTVGSIEDVSVTEASGLGWGRSHVPPKIMIPAGTELPDGTVLSEALASPGTIYGTAFVDGSLTVEGPLIVDGQVLIGDQMGSPLGTAILKRNGNRNAEPPTKPVVIWADTKVHGPLTIHGSLIVRRSLYFLGDISFGGTMGTFRCGRLIFFPAGAYPIAQQIQSGCPAS